MDDRVARLESAVEQLSSTVRSLERRIGLLEAPPVGVPTPATDMAHQAPEVTMTQKATRAGRAPDDPIAILSLIGRLFLVLAGGFFLRAMTESGLLLPQIGISLAFGYALVWLYLADRASRRGNVMNASFHAAGFAMVAFPLLVEATTRFKVLAPAGAALGLALLTVVLLWVAWRRRFPAAAWIAIVGALPTTAVLLLKTGVTWPFAIQPIALGVATLWMGYEFGWKAIRWPAALVATLVVAGLSLRALSPQYPDTLRIAVLMQGLLLLAYAVSIAIRTVGRGRPVGWFEVTQTALVLLVSIGGSLMLAVNSGARTAAIGLVSLLLGSACYAIDVAILEKRESPEQNLYFYTTLALVLVLAGTVFLIPAPWSGLLFAVLAVAATGLWAHLGRLYLLVHGAAYLFAAVAASGELVYGARALAAAAGGAWLQPGVALVMVLLASAASAWLAARRPAPEGGSVASGLRLVIILACTWAVAGCLTGWLVPWLAGLTERGVEPGALATVRTAVLALGTLVVAWIGRHPRFREWSWLVYPLLVVTGLKMVAQDFSQSRPATLFIALALYGAALIIAPRLRKPPGGVAAPVQVAPTAVSAP